VIDDKRVNSSINYMDSLARPDRQISGEACAACERHFIENKVREI